VAPPLMPEWENFAIRDFFKQTFPSAYVVVDNDVNIMALGHRSQVKHFNNLSRWLFATFRVNFAV
jgi:predicted NBD/HSP70 family sugar kinase